MSTNWVLLVADFLDRAADEFANHGCNDWKFPEHWMAGDKHFFVREMYRDNGDPENFDPKNLNVPNWWVMRFLANRLREEVSD